MRPRLLSLAAFVLLPFSACTDRGGPVEPPLSASASRSAQGATTAATSTTWTVESLIDALFSTQNRQSARSSWNKVVAAKTASPSNAAALLAAVNDLTKWTLSRLANNQLNDPDGAGPLNATTGAMKLLQMVYAYAGVAASELPSLGTGNDLNFAIVTPTTPDITLTTSLGDGQVVIPQGTFAGTVVLVIARQPQAVTVNTPFPVQSRVFDVSIAPEVPFTPFVVAICPFAGIPHDVNERSIVAHQKSESVVEYLPRASVTSLTCPETIGSAWREEQGVVRQRLAQAVSFLRAASSLLTPSVAYAGHAAIGASLAYSLSPSVLVDPYVATSIAMPPIGSTTYGSSVAASATLTMTGGATVSGASVVFTLDGNAGAAQSVATDGNGVASLSYAMLPAGSHTVTTSYAGGVGPGGVPVYGSSASSVTFTVAPAPLSATADDKSRQYGLANPPLTGTLTGVRNGEAITVSYSTSASSTSPVGSYAIVPTVDATPEVLANYAISLTNGTLLVTRAPLEVAYVPKSLLYPDGPGCTVTYTGFRLTDGPSSLGGTLTCSGPSGALSDPFAVGTYTVTPGGLTSGNYTITFVPGTVTVTRLYGTLTFKSPVSLGDQRAGYQAGNNIPVAFYLYERDNVTPVANAVATVSMSGVSIPASKSVFVYDPLTRLYQLNIKTSSTTALGVHVITVQLDDNTTRTVEVEIK